MRFRKRLLLTRSALVESELEKISKSTSASRLRDMVLFRAK